MEGDYEDKMEAADDLLDQQVHGVEVLDAVDYLEGQGYDGETGNLEQADRVILVESPSAIEEGIEFRFLQGDQDTPYAVIDVEDDEDYGWLLE